MKLPDWANKYFTVQNNLLYISLNTENEYFSKVKQDLKTRMRRSFLEGKSSQDILDSYCFEYSLCNIALGITKYNKALLQKENTGNEKRKSVNDGSGQQHWLPECYTKHFSKNGKVLRVSEGEMSKMIEMQSHPDNVINRLVPINSHEFKEGKKTKGRFYAPWFELVLSYFEDDYGQILKQKSPAVDLWSYVVIYYFFLILDNRTKERKESLTLDWDGKENLLLNVLPSIVSNSRLVIIDKDMVFTEEIKNLNVKFPFNQHPVQSTINDEGQVSLWAIFNRDTMLWFSHKDDTIEPTRQLFFTKLTEIIGTGNKKVYFHPDDFPWVAYQDSAE